MLQSIRDKATGWIAYVIIGLISIPFVFFGVQSYLGAGGKTVVAKVNGEEISIEAFQQALQQQQVKIREMFGGALPEGLLDGEEIKRSVLDRLISTELMMQYVNENGYNVSDSTVAEIISQIPVFQENGVFSPEKYELVLKQQRINRAAFEQQIRGDALLNQLPTAVSLTEALTEQEKKLWVNLKNEKRTVKRIRFSENKFLQAIQISDEEVRAYYDAHASDFMEPEKVKIAYLLLDESALSDKADVTDEELRAFYEEDIARYQTPESLELKKILIAFDDQAGEEAKTVAKEKAQALYEELKNGADFSEKAKSLSDDRFTAEKGGEIKDVRRGDFSKAFEDIVFSLNEGELSQPFETQAGFEIVKVEKKIPSKPRPFSEVKDRVQSDFLSQKAERSFIEKSEQLATLAYETPDSLDEVSQAVGLPLQESGWFSNNEGEGIAEYPSVRNAAFSAEVKQDNQNSEVIEIEPGKQVVLRIIDIKPSAPKGFEIVSSQIREYLKRQRAHEQLSEEGQKALELARSEGQSLAEIAKKFSVEVEDLEVDRESQNIPGNALKEIFRLTEPGKIPGGDLAGIDTGNGEYWLVKLENVNHPEVDSTLAEASVPKRTDEFLDAMLKAMESRAKIEIFESALE